MKARGVALLAATVSVLAIIAATAVAKPLYGVVPQNGGLPSAADLEKMPKAGIGSIRLILHWGSIESTPGEYAWATPDAMVREATNRGIQPLFFLYGTPDWAAQADGRSCSGDACSIMAPASDQTRDAFARFATAAVERYGPGGDFWQDPLGPVSREPDPRGAVVGPVPCGVVIPCPPTGPPPVPPGPPPPPTEPPCQCEEPSPLRKWQLWNEQNSPKYFGPQVNVARYGKMVKTVSAAIKGVDPGAEVILGGMWGPGSARKQVLPVKPYLKRLYKIGGIAKSFDSFGVHPYASTVARSVDRIELVRKQARRAGDRKVGTWITEMGWAAGGPPKNPYVKGLQGQARLLSRALSKFSRRARSFRLEGVFWYSWRDLPGGSSICDWCGHAGLRAKDGSAKPAWKAFARLARS